MFESQDKKIKITDPIYLVYVVSMLPGLLSS